MRCNVFWLVLEAVIAVTLVPTEAVWFQFNNMPIVGSKKLFVRMEQVDNIAVLVYTLVLFVVEWQIRV